MHRLVVITRFFLVIVILTLVTTTIGCGPAGVGSAAPAADATPLTISTLILPQGVIATTYDSSLSAAGGTAPYSWIVVSGNLPSGLVLASSGRLSGTPTASGTSTFDVQVTDGAKQLATRRYQLTIIGNSLGIATVSLPAATLSVPYSTVLSVTGGSPPLTLSLGSGSLPVGLTMASNGTISGTPTVLGASQFVVNVSDSSGQFISRQFQIVVNSTPLAIITNSLAAGTVSAAYNATLAASGGLTPYTWSKTAGTLPAGLAFSGAGLISGTPTVPGTFAFTATVNDSLGQSQGRQFSITINPAALSITTTSLANGTAGTSYTDQVLTSGGFGAVSISVTSGALPTGLSIAANGTISGTPTVVGDFNFTVTATDAAAQSVSRNLSIHIAATTLVINANSLSNGTVGSAYSASLAASGGVVPYNWTITAGTLPAGLSLATTGSITGTPTAPGTSVFTASVSDNSGQQQSHQFSITINPQALSITTSALASGAAGTPYSDQVLTAGGFGAISISVTSGALPTGLAMASNGTISGTPSVVGDFPFTATATDAATQSVSRNLTIHIAATALVISSNSLPNGTVSTAYSATLVATGGTTPYSWSVTSGSLPNGLSLSSGGAITGTPTAPGTFVFTATVNDGSGQQQSHQFSITINPQPLMITTAALPSGVSGTAYSTQVLTSGGFGAITITLASGSLPAGLSIASNGTISGTPTGVGDFNFIVSAADTASQVVTRSLSIHIAASSLVIDTMGLPAGSVGVLYSSPVSASGGLTPYTWSLAAGSLPPGLSISAGGVISGTPTANGTFGFTVQVNDSSAQVQTKALSLTINASNIDVSPLALSDATQNVAYSATITASGGTGPYTFAVLSGALPTGLTLSSGGSLSGAPTTLGSFSFVIQATDTFAQTGSRAYSVTVNPSPLQITTASLPGGTVSQSYTASLSSTGGTLPVSWSVSAGALPAGLTLSSSGTLSGTPTTAGTSTFTIQVADSAAQTATHQFSVTINPAPLVLSTSSLPSGQAGTSYTTSLVSTGGTLPYTYSIVAGALPGGLTLSGGGSITGTPGAAGSFPVTIRVTDAAAQTAQRAFTLVVNPPPLQITTASLPGGTVGVAYSASMAFSGGTAPVTWTISAGTLPNGVTMSSAGVFSGTPTTAQSKTFTVKATDSGAQVATQQYSVTINPAPLVLSTSSLPSGQVGTAYSTTLASTGGTTPYTYSVIAGALPTGVTLSSGGTISGTPTVAGSFGVTIKVTDSAAQTAQRAFTLVISPPPLQITTASLPSGTVTQAYSATMAFSGGTAPVTWTISAGTLPAGVTMSTAGAFSGTPTTAGSSTFTVKATDSGSQVATQQYSVTVNPAPLVLNTLTLPNGQLNTAYSTTLSASGGTLPLSWNVQSGSLPAGLTLGGSTGILSGTPTAFGSFTVTLRVQDAGAQSVQRQFTFSILPPALSITTATLPDTVVGTSYSTQLQQSGGVAPFNWTLQSGNLPTGLALSTSGLISGVSSSTGSFAFNANVTDAAAQSVSKQFTINVAPTPLSLTTTSLPNAVGNQPYSAPLAASGGTPPYSWSIVSGALPATFTLSSDGVINGNPTTAGSGTFTVKLLDAQGQTAQRQFTLTVDPMPLTISTGTLPDGRAGTAYSVTLQGSGGVAPYVWTVSQGSLPQGLTLATNGVLSGTPAATGQSTFTVQLKDANLTITTRSFTLNVVPVFRITLKTFYGGIVGTPFTLNVSVADNSGPVTWSLTSGTLPPGLTLSTTTGAVTGTPTTAGNSAFTIGAIDGSGKSVTAAYFTTTSPNDPNYGNVGDPYATEGGGPNGSATLISSCQTLPENHAYRLTKAVSASNTGAVCFTLGGSKTVLDLGGFSVIGRIVMNADASGVSVFNGTISCNWPDNGGDAGCLKIVSQNQSTAQLRLHHLTINNAGQEARALHINWDIPSMVSGYSIRVYNITSTVPAQPTVPRSFAISMIGNNQTIEVTNNEVTCDPQAAGCQAIMCFANGDCKAHHNHINLPVNTSDQIGRGILLDQSFTGEVWNNTVMTTNNRAVRVRDTFHVRIHDNTFLQITNSTQAIGAVHMGDPDPVVPDDDLDALVDNNIFEIVDGTGVFVRDAYNLTIRNNTIKCPGNICTGQGQFVIAREPKSAVSLPGRSEANVFDNPTAILTLPPPQNSASPGAQLTICNSGSGGGLGTIIPLPSPCPQQP